MTSGSFVWPVRVYIEDTDAGGIVFYANYLRFMERARTEFIRSLGFSRLETVDLDAQFVVHSLALQYHSPARLDDEVAVSAHIVKLGRTYMEFEQNITRGAKAELLVSGRVKVACIDKVSFKPRPIPGNLASALQKGINV
ncbi:tol-pal system-associated acyl-CoA thioesterase [Hahella sp. KA22]|uniref:tol-pal system-associated acyl-CoA thioesterase n=1 Tax=Hahella sp. KA22 TaxID=1628392 RepID=UPI000FDE7B76|nr:tol-pal system-associated acyl-CoA thioesterase [Hahella sp. KA22]AZZ91197.1 tol-pal system-associated acyl-CoA thioesterase [Hahella sp. KA22]QAY54565.1 tol-pal system-associated acyl-CoA thioesterase [Hahella sp. KA22]